jgi:hypothetical protein
MTMIEWLITNIGNFLYNLLAFPVTLAERCLGKSYRWIGALVLLPWWSVVGLLLLALLLLSLCGVSLTLCQAWALIARSINELSHFKL